jgi:hypothetical protein
MCDRVREREREREEEEGTLFEANGIHHRIFL